MGYTSIYRIKQESDVSQFFSKQKFSIELGPRSGDCGECIRDPDCAWCLDPDWTGPDGRRRRPRCDLRTW